MREEIKELLKEWNQSREECCIVAMEKVLSRHTLGDTMEFIHSGFIHAKSGIDFYEVYLGEEMLARAELVFPQIKTEYEYE